MPLAFHCPFYGSDRKSPTTNGSVLSGECGRLTFKTTEHRDDYVLRYCANWTDWKNCPLAESLFRSVYNMDLNDLR